MKTIAELNKERLLCRKSNPRRSSVLTLLIDGATKLAKIENRSVEEKDLYKIAQLTIKEIDKDISLMIEKKQCTLDLEIDRKIWEEFLPKLLSKSEIKRILLQKFPEDLLVKANIGRIMKEMKSIPDMDMSLLSEVVNSTISM